MRFSSLFCGLPLVGLCACATDAPSRADFAELTREMRAERDKSTRLEHRLEMLEAGAAVGEGARTASSSTPSPSPSASIPELTVVKLRPKVEPAPKLDTHVPVVEPSPELLDALHPDEDPAKVALAPEDPEILEAEFNQSLRALRTGNVLGGSAKLEQFAREHPRDAHADNALYYCGVGLMGLEDFSGAAERFERVVREYPAGDAVADALVRLAECRMHLNRPIEAKALYTQVTRTFPGTAAAHQAQQRLASLSR